MTVLYFTYILCLFTCIIHIYINVLSNLLSMIFFSFYDSRNEHIVNK